MLKNFHYECAVRMAAGSVGHQNRTCACYRPFDSVADTEHDPPGMTRRQAARAAYELYLARSTN